jgi:hypothetical protein
MVRPDKHGVADRVSNRIRTAQGARTEKDLGNGGVRLHDTAKGGPIDFQRDACFAGLAADQGAAARELIHFAGKRAGPERSERVASPFEMPRISRLPLTTMNTLWLSSPWSNRASPSWLGKHRVCLLGLSGNGFFCRDLLGGHVPA